MSFEYLEGSYADAKFRSTETNKAVLENDSHSSGSTRLRGQKLQEALKKYKLQSFTGSKGLLYLLILQAIIEKASTTLQNQGLF